MRSPLRFSAGWMSAGQLKPFFLHLLPKVNGRRTTVAEPSEQTELAQDEVKRHRSQDESRNRRVDGERQPDTDDKAECRNESLGH
jgi:hypothetical protein